MEEALPSRDTHLLHEVAQEDGLLPQRVVHQPVREEDHALWEVVLGQPRHHPLLLHVRPPRDVEDHVAQVLPVPGETALQGPAPPRAGHPLPSSQPHSPLPPAPRSQTGCSQEH